MMQEPIKVESFTLIRNGIPAFPLVEIGLDDSLQSWTLHTMVSGCYLEEHGVTAKDIMECLWGACKGPSRKYCYETRLGDEIFWGVSVHGDIFADGSTIVPSSVFEEWPR